MSERQETIADIVAEKRTQADRIERVAAAKMASGKMTSDHFAREVVATLRTEAARLEAAAKRERNNAAAMRDALEAFVEYSELALRMGMFTHDRLVAITAKARAALSAPPCNLRRYLKGEIMIYLTKEATDKDINIILTTANGVIDTLFAEYRGEGK